MDDQASKVIVLQEKKAYSLTEIQEVGNQAGSR